MVRFGLDSTSEVSPVAHHAMGSTVAIRYLSRYTSKVVTAAEHADYLRNGIDLFLVFEDSATNALMGYAQGKADAEWSLNQGIGILGKPATPPRVTWAVDFDPTGQEAATDAYSDGWAAVFTPERTGPYGGYNMIAHGANRGCKVLFQTYAWSAGQFFAGSQVYQYSNDHYVGGVDTDFDHIYPNAQGDFGQWDYKPATPVPNLHYLWLATANTAAGGLQGGPFHLKAGILDERLTVMKYDRLRQHPVRNAAALLIVREQLRELAGRDFVVAHKTTPVDWTSFHRGWRYQALIHRAQGKRFI